jgi:GTP-binding protein EngB required for normal cell division
MPPDPLRLLDALDRAVAAVAEVAPEEVVRESAEAAARWRQRLGLLGDTVLVALAGGTGSGKSSLLNAIAGGEVAATGALRPTTAEPLAWIPAEPEPGLVRFLDELGVRQRSYQQSHPWLAVLDLPDTDSVETDHRATVEALLPWVDAVVWVVDPEKYQDRALHTRYLAPLASHRHRFRFVLNQSDRLPAAARQEVVEDLRRSLAEDGIPDAVIHVVAADPPAGPPEGVEELVAAFRASLDVRRLVTETVRQEVSRWLGELAERLGGPTGWPQRWEQIRQQAAAALLGVGESERPQQVEQLRVAVAEAAESLGGEPALSLRELAAAVDPQVEEAVAAVLAQAPPPAPPRGWKGWALRRVGWGRQGHSRLQQGWRSQAASMLSDELDRRLGVPVRVALRLRGHAAATLTEIRLSLEQ